MTNTTRQVVLGDQWEYLDPDDGGWIRWRVDELNEDGTGTLRKLTGRDPGFPARDYPVSLMPESSQWRWVDGTAKPKVTFACPHCGNDEPINEGDYVCGECRTALDER